MEHKVRVKDRTRPAYLRFRMVCTGEIDIDNVLKALGSLSAYTLKLYHT